MKLFLRMCMFLGALSCAIPSFAVDENKKEENKPNMAKSFFKGAFRLPFEIGKNITGGLTILGIGVTGVCAYLWLVQKVNAGGLNMTKMNLTQQYLETFSNPGPREQLEWLQIQLYKNIDVATLTSGAATVTSGFVYLLFKSFADTLK